MLFLLNYNIYKCQLLDQSLVKFGGGQKWVASTIFPFFLGGGRNWGVFTTFSLFFGGGGCLKIFLEAFYRGPPVNFFSWKKGWSCNWLTKKWIKWDIGGLHVNFFFEITYSFPNKAFLLIHTQALPNFGGNCSSQNIWEHQQSHFSHYCLFEWIKKMKNLYFLNIEKSLLTSTVHFSGILLFNLSWLWSN